MIASLFCGPYDASGTGYESSIRVSSNTLLHTRQWTLALGALDIRSSKPSFIFICFCVCCSYIVNTCSICTIVSYRIKSVFVSILQIISVLVLISQIKSSLLQEQFSFTPSNQYILTLEFSVQLICYSAARRFLFFFVLPAISPGLTLCQNQMICRATTCLQWAGDSVKANKQRALGSATSK